MIPAITSEQLRARMLNAINPAHGQEPPARWQQRKSAQTRLRLVEAGIDCLVISGYAGLTTAAVAERCSVSRGTMHHHFATRLELVAAVVEHVVYKRMHRFLEDYFDALSREGEERLIEVASEAYWRSVQTNEYAAYLLLAVAARTDGELNEIFQPAAHRFDEVWNREMLAAFPQWHSRTREVLDASDFFTTFCMGLLLHAPVLESPARVRRVLDIGIEMLQIVHARGEAREAALRLAEAAEAAAQAGGDAPRADDEKGSSAGNLD